MKTLGYSVSNMTLNKRNPSTTKGRTLRQEPAHGGQPVSAIDNAMTYQYMERNTVTRVASLVVVVRL